MTPAVGHDTRYDALAVTDRRGGVLPPIIGWLDALRRRPERVRAPTTREFFTPPLR